MAHDKGAHTWGPIYELEGASYRECSDPDCHGHQEWICALDRWSDAFDTPSPRVRQARAAKQEPKPTGAG